MKSFYWIIFANILLTFNLFSAIPQIERQALTALYNSTNGDNWTDNSGWKTPPLHTDGFAMPGTEGTWKGITVTNNSVPTISLYSNNLTGSIPNQIGNLAQLKYLYLYNNQVNGSIPPEIGNLVNLQHLYLFNNRLNGYYPESLVNLVKIVTPNGFQCYGNYLELANNASQQLVDWLNTHSQYWQPISALEREALITFYNSSYGDNWNNKTGWKTPPLHTDGFAMPGTEHMWNGVTLTNGSVTKLSFNSNKLSGSIPGEIGNLTNLNLLNLYSNQLSGSIPPEIGNLINLTSLNLSVNQFSGQIPPEIGSLIYLTGLNLSKNQLSGPIPPVIGNLINLTSLNLSYNQLSGSIPTEIGNLKNLTSIILCYNQFTGFFPESLVNLTKVSTPNGFQCYGNYLELADDASQTLIDWLNAHSYQWSQLSLKEREALIALYNATNGDNWNNKTGWKTAPLHTDGFSLPGTEVSWYGVTITNGSVTKLSLNLNKMSGYIPPEIGDLTNVTVLSIQDNQLSGTIPSSIGNLVNLTGLYMNNNKLTGSIPAEIGNLSLLTKLYLNNNQIIGAIPASIGNLVNLTTLNFNTNLLNGSIPVEIGNLINLITLDLASNQLSGPIPPEIGNLSNRLEYLYLQHNQLSGALPSAIGNLVNLKYLYINNNQFSGYFPESLVNLTNIYSDYPNYGFSFSGNALQLAPDASQALIDWIAAHSEDPLPIPQIEREALIALYNATNGDNWTDNNGWKTPPLHTDGFAMPGTESNWYGINKLRSGNHVFCIQLGETGDDPPILSNNLVGVIPPEIGNLTSLIYLNLSSNQLNGPVPIEIGNLINLKELNLSHNQLSGPIFDEIIKMKELHCLKLSYNMFNGEFPQQIGTLKNLYIFHIHYNQFTGYFPESLVNLTNMHYGYFCCGGNFLQLPANASQVLIDWLNDRSLDWNPIPHIEREALIALYNATNGNNWFNNQDWKTPPLHTDGFAMPGTEYYWSRIDYGFGIQIENGHVKEIRLDKNNLSGFLPPEIGNLMYLQWFDIGRNPIGGYFPETLTQLTSPDLLFIIYDTQIQIAVGSSAELRHWLNSQNSVLLYLDRMGLIALYNATNGDNWTKNTGWKTPPLHTDGFAKPGTEKNWYGVGFDEDSQRVGSLNLSNNNLSGSIPAGIVNLTALNYLYMTQNHLNGPIPIEILKTMFLKSIYLNFNNFTGSIPPEIGDLTHINDLNLSDNQLNGAIPPEIGNLSQLEYLEIQNNQLSGPIPPEISNLINLRVLNLSHNQLSGYFPESLVNLTKIYSGPYEGGFSFAGNALQIAPDASQALKDWLAAHSADPLPLPQLEREALIAIYQATDGDNWTNNSGWKTPPLHTDGFAMPGTEVNWYGIYIYEGHVRAIWLNNYQEFSSLIRQRNKTNRKEINQKIIDLWKQGKNSTAKRGNKLRGQIPPEIGNLLQLEYLELRNNQLNGPIPPEIGNLINLRILDLSHNQLSGYFPESLINLTKIVSGPEEYGFFFAGNALQIAPNASQALKDWLAAHSADPLPIPQIEREALIALYQATDGDNWTDNSGWKTPPLHTDGFAMPGTEDSWHGIEVYNGHVMEIWLNHNQLNGPIPLEIGNLVNLNILDLSYNQLSGYFPESLVNLVNIFLACDEPYEGGFRFAGNALQIAPDASQALIDWLFAHATDPLPILQIEREALIALYNATDGDNWADNSGWKTPPLHTDGFAMPGTESNWYGIGVSMGHVRTIWLNNYQEFLSLIRQRNKTNRKEINQKIIDFWLQGKNSTAKRGNQLRGQIPPEIGNLSQLEWLELSHNQLNGPIPPEIGNLVNLNILDLSYNQLSGYFPESLVNLVNIFLACDEPYEGGFRFAGNALQIAPDASQALIDWLIAHSEDPLPLLQIEREALIALYHATDGDNWADNSGWKTPPLHTDGFAMPGTESNWYGINVIEGHVQAIWLNNYQEFLSLIRQRNTTNQKEINQKIIDFWLQEKNSTAKRGNQLRGQIPPEIGNLSHLEWLELSHNQLNGPIPPEIGNLINLYILDLSHNQLSGYFPESLVNLVNIFSGPYDWGFYFAGNALQIAPDASQALKDWLAAHSTDPLPISQIEREALIALYQATDGDNWTDNSGWKTPPLHTDGFAMPGTESNWYGINVIEGHVQAIWLNNYQEFLSLIRQRNKTNRKEINQKIIDFWLQGKNSTAKRGNQLRGQMPPEISNLSQLEYLELSNNQLSGPIPVEIGNLFKLVILDLSYNHLNGFIPPQISNLINLQYLYLQNNQFTGYFPENLTKLKNISNGYFKCGQNMLKLADNASQALKDWLNTESTDWMNQNSCPYDHLVGSFANMGIWLRDSENGAWTQWSKQQADIIRLADMDGNGVDDMLALFRSTNKLWLRYDDGVWQEIKASAATLTAFALADMNADGKADIIGSWSDLGLWWLDTASGDWSKLSNLVPSLLTAADLDGDGKADVVGLFPTLNSIWIYSSNQTWKQISKQVNLIDLRAADLDGDGQAELVGSWDIGVWQFAPQTNQWTRHHASQASQIALGDIDAASFKDIVGYWSTATPLFVKYLELNTWKKLSNYQPLTIDSGRVK